MAFVSKSQQAVNEMRTLFSGLDAPTRGQVLTDLYGTHETLVNEEIERIRSTAFSGIPVAAGDTPATAPAPEQPTHVQPRAKVKTHKQPRRVQRATTATATATKDKPAKEGEKRTRAGQRQLGSLFDAMLQVIAKQEKSKEGYATRKDIIAMTKHIESEAETDKERYDLVGSYLQLLKKVRKLVMTKKDKAGKEIKGQYYLTDAGRERIELLKKEKLDLLKV